MEFISTCISIITLGYVNGKGRLQVGEKKPKSKVKNTFSCSVPHNFVVIQTYQALAFPV